MVAHRVGGYTHMVRRRERPSLKPSTPLLPYQPEQLPDPAAPVEGLHRKPYLLAVHGHHGVHSGGSSGSKRLRSRRRLDEPAVEAGQGRDVRTDDWNPCRQILQGLQGEASPVERRVRIGCEADRKALEVWP